MSGGLPRGDAVAPGPRRSGTGRGSDDAACALALASLPGMGRGTLRSLLGREPARSCWERVCSGALEPLATRGRGVDAVRRHGARWRDAARTTRPDEAFERCAELGVTVHVIGSPTYPECLLGAPSPPPIVFSAGSGTDAIAARTPRVAVLGTRSCTHYGEEVAAELGAGLAACGVTVVSGMSPGIDAAAHEGALAGAEAAPPLAVLGCGVDVVYPAASRRLRARVADRGLLLAEALPGAPPERWRFPARSRLVAVLSDVVVVVESHRSGGAMHAVDAALGRGIPVAAVPGSVRSAASRGTNGLIADGAAVARDVADVLALLALRRAGSPAGRERTAAARGEPGKVAAVRAAGEPSTGPAVGGASSRVLAALHAGAGSLEPVARATGLSLEAAALALEELVATGRARRRAGGYEAGRTPGRSFC